MRITWLGHSAFLIEGKNKVLVDPFLTGNPVAAISAEDVDCDIICVTHGHMDHLGDATNIARRTGAIIAAIVEMSNYFEKLGVESVGFNLGGTAKVLKTKITMVPAFHSSSINAPGLEFSAAMPVGMIIDSGKVVYHAGDTAVFGDMKIIGDLYRPDVAMLPIGGFYTMDAKQASLAVKLIRPKAVIPMHYNTFPPIKADPKGFAELVKKQSKGTKVVILKPGDTLDL
jgi:L-ascorbate metabolism protein UlaG (beta-lactamase superfamily)